jgi:16S rRNA (uracil1498-N3)-methyltransferase
VGPAPRPAAHVFVDDLSSPELSMDDRHHLERVLRLRPGEEITVADGRGGWRRCRYVGSGRLEVGGPAAVADTLLPAVTVGFAVIKGERPEWVVQKLTEVGVDRIVPLLTERTVARWDGERAARQVERLRAIARAAAMQSRRIRLPQVDEVTSFRRVVAAAGSAAALAQRGGGPISLARPVVLVGPEGGFSEAEAACGLPTVDLGPAVLRAETAALAAGILLCALRVGLVSAKL